MTPGLALHRGRGGIVVGHLRIKPLPPLLPDHSHSTPAVCTTNLAWLHNKHRLVYQLHLPTSSFRNQRSQKTLLSRGHSFPPWWFAACCHPLHLLINGDGRRGHSRPRLSEIPTPGAAVSISWSSDPPHRRDPGPGWGDLLLRSGQMPQRSEDWIYHFLFTKKAPV